MRYRGIHILCDDFNIVFGKMFIPSLKFGIIIGFTCCLFAVLRLMSSLNFISIMVMILGTVGCTCTIVPMSIIMSSLFNASAQFKKNISPITRLIAVTKMRIQIEGQLKACSLIRCQVGSLYHMEAKAKLTLLQHMVNALVCLMVNVRV